MKKDVDRSLKMGKVCEDAVSHINGQQKVTSAKKEFINQVERRIHSVNNSLFPQSSPSLPNGSMNKMTGTGFSRS